MGASIDDFAWTAARPYFTREGNPQTALRNLLDHPYFNTLNSSGESLWAAFINRPKTNLDDEVSPLDVLYYLNQYFNDFFERWTDAEATDHNKCVGRILQGSGGLTMQMLDGKTRSSPYWDPYLYVALKSVDPDSVNTNGLGAFRGLIKQYEAWNGCRIIHYNSKTEIWNSDYGIRIKAYPDFFETIKTELSNLKVTIEQFDEESSNEPYRCWLLRTRVADDSMFRDYVDRIMCCKNLLKIIVKQSSSEYPNEI